MARKRGTGAPVKTLSKSEVAALNKKLGPRGIGVRSRISQKERVLSTGKGWGRDTKVEHSEERERQRRKPYGRKSDASRTAGEKALPRGGGRAKDSAARAAATRKKNIAASKKAGTYVRSTAAQTARNRAAARSDARTRVGGGSPGSRVAGGLARVRGR
tara:strand:+ start:39 stop:515 length:477 start_codon:yes stop_codon:yes gene_type:complete